MGDLQSAWLILSHCASARANYLLRVVEPQAVADYARTHDDNESWPKRGHQEQCQFAIGFGPISVLQPIGPVGQIAFQWCLRATVVSLCQSWRNWRGTPTPHFGGQLQLARGHWSAQWVLTPHPGHWNQMRWNQALLEEGGRRHFRHMGSETGRFFGPKAVLVLRSLGACAGAAVQIDSFGHHHAMQQNRGIGSVRSCTREALQLEVCPEQGARVTTNVLVRDLNLPLPEATDNRRLEVVADGLPIFGGSLLTLDTLGCALHCDGSPHTGAANTEEA